MQVVKLITNEQATEYNEGLICAGAFMDNGMRWDNYVNKKSQINKDDIIYLEALKEYILDKNIRLPSEQYIRNAQQFLFDNNTTAYFTSMAWADFMAAIWADEDKTNYTYIDWMY